jgi:hypothetical protein
VFKKPVEKYFSGMRCLGKMKRNEMLKMVDINMKEA